jgi:hypothetical protein
LARLESQGTLAPAQRRWIGKINGAIAALPDAKLITSPVKEKLATLEQIDGTYDGMNEISPGNQVHAKSTILFDISPIWHGHYGHV